MPIIYNLFLCEKLTPMKNKPKNHKLMKAVTLGDLKYFEQNFNIISLITINYTL